MMTETFYASDFIGKDVLNLDSGDLVGKINGILVDDQPLKVSAFVYQTEETEEGMQFCDFSLVTDVDQQVVVISSSKTYLPGDVKTLLGLSCLDAGGKLVGKICDFSWSSETELVTELVVRAENEAFGIAISDLAKLGSGAAILNVPAGNIHRSTYQRAGTEQRSEDAEEMIRNLIRRVGATLSEAGQKVGERVRQIDTEELNRDINRFTEKVGKEIRNVIDNLAEQSKASKNATMDSEVISVLRDLEGFTVSSAIYDNDGILIILPGHEIDENVVRRVISSGKVAELYRVAVSIKHGDENE